MLVFHFSSLLPDSSSSQLTAAAVWRCCRPPAAPLSPRSRVTRASPRKTSQQNMTAEWSGKLFCVFYSIYIAKPRVILSLSVPPTVSFARSKLFFFFLLLLSWLSSPADGYSVSVSRGVKAGFSHFKFCRNLLLFFHWLPSITRKLKKKWCWILKHSGDMIDFFFFFQICCSPSSPPLLLHHFSDQ